MKKRRPQHPGIFIREEYQDRLGLTGRQISRALGVINSRMNKVLRGQAPVGADLALRLSTVLGRSPRGWLAMQGEYDLWMAARTIKPSSMSSLDKARPKRARPRRGPRKRKR